MDNGNERILQIESLKKHFQRGAGVFRQSKSMVRAVDGIELVIRKGETLGVVGESGCGKSTLGRLIVRLLDPTEGRIIFSRDGESIDLAKIQRKDLKQMRRHFNMVFQDPSSSLNPRMNVRNIVAEPLMLHRFGNKRQIDERVEMLLEGVGLKASHMQRFPHAFSGGQKQRIAVARALALNPAFIVCDEPTSALDVSVQSQILNLIMRLQKDFELTYLFISHDVGVVRHVSDRMAVMYLGKLVEIGEADRVCTSPIHPYTESLLSAVPIPDPKIHKKKVLLKGSIPDPSNPPPGCRFSTRCPYAQRVCNETEPDLRPLPYSEDRLASCHFLEELHLSGVGS